MWKRSTRTAARRVLSAAVLGLLILSVAPHRTVRAQAEPNPAAPVAPGATEAPATPEAPVAPAAPVVLIPAFGGSPEQWPDLIATFTKAGYRQGETLFTLDLRKRPSREAFMGLWDDAAFVLAEIQRIRQQTGAAQVDLIGHSRGAVLARILATGESAQWVRRAVSLDGPHAGVLSEAEATVLLKAIGLPAAYRAALGIPMDLEPNSAALQTIDARQRHFADRAAPAFVVATTWHAGAPAFLANHDGMVSLSSQTAWVGTSRQTYEIGPPGSSLKNVVTLTDVVMNNPHGLVVYSQEVIDAVLQYLSAPSVPGTVRTCDPECHDWSSMPGHWSFAWLQPWLDRLPYTVDDAGVRDLAPNRPMTRAEFVYTLDKALQLPEQLRAPSFHDTVGHWSLGYVEAASTAGIVRGTGPDTFEPDRPLTRAEAAVLLTRALKLQLPSEPNGFPDADQHWAAASIAAAKKAGIVTGGPDGLFRPNDPVTVAEGSVMITRSFWGATH